MIKKKYLFILLVILLLGLSGQCYAVSMVKANYNKSTIDVWDYLIENYYATVGDITDSNNFTSNPDSYANFQSLENLVYSSNYACFYCRADSYTNHLYVLLSDTDITFSYNSGATAVTPTAESPGLTCTMNLQNGKYQIPNQRFK